MVGKIVTADTISKIVKQAGTYLFAKTYSRELPLCDSTVSFQLTVRHPDYKTPVNVITTTLESNYPYEWYGQEYNETGQYLHPIDKSQVNGISTGIRDVQKFFKRCTLW